MKKKETDLLINSGILFEINRQILHPLGFNIAVEKRPTYDDESEIVIYNYNDDKEKDFQGLVYTDEALKVGARNIINYLSKVEILNNRHERFGDIIQPLPIYTPFEKKNKLNKSNKKCKSRRKSK